MLTEIASRSRVRTQEQDALVDNIKIRIEKMAAYFGRQAGLDEDDLRQEAWIAVLEMLPRLDTRIGSPDQHLLKRARWRIQDSIRSQRRRQHVALDDMDDSTLLYRDSHTGLDLMSELNNVLTPIQRRILRALIEGYTWREAGALMGCTSANVAYHVRKIREAYLRLNVD